MSDLKPLRPPFLIRARLFGAAVFGWISYRIAPRELRPFIAMNMQFAENLKQIQSERRWGVLTSGWAMGDDRDHELGHEMHERVSEAAAVIRERIERREFERAMSGHNAGLGTQL